MKTRKNYVKYVGLSVIIALGVVLVSFKKIKQFITGSSTDGTIYEFTIAKKGIMIDDATCYAWIPEDVGN